MGYMPINLMIGVRKLNFLSALNRARMSDTIAVLLQNEDEQINLCKKYNCPSGTRSRWKTEIWRYFESVVEC